MSTKEIENNLKKIKIPKEHNPEFIHNFLLAFGKPKSSISRLRSGTYNLSKSPDEILWKNTVLFKYSENKELHFIIDELKHKEEIIRHKPRFIIVTDYRQLLAVDTKTEETLDISINDLSKHYVFFLPWAGMEKKGIEVENIADIKAAERMAKLYDEIIKCNEKNTSEFYHSLNVFFARLLFCFFAEDTEVFNKGQFTTAIASYTLESGSDLHEFLDELFKALDLENKNSHPSHIKAFPYVNGGLFNKPIPSPQFNKAARQILLQCGELDWSQINPDIFGSMIQAVVHPGQRASLGMHYTSVENIMKVINPLFLEDLHDEFKKSFNDVKKLKRLLQRIYAIKVLDPACGSGNFLIIAYKELRKLEHSILQRITALEHGKVALFNLSGVKLENFYGIEIDDFAHEIAILSLWLAKHQMNIEFKQLFGIEISLIPLRDMGNVFCGNALRTDWEAVCPIDEKSEIYIFGNPPYLGARNQTKEQKLDLEIAAKGTDFIEINSIDYISGWFIKAKEYIKSSNTNCAFVSTNSICQGDHISLLWSHILKDDIEIIFAHRSFKWVNNAKNNAGVICIIVGIGKKNRRQKIIYEGAVSIKAQNISPYLTDTKTIFIARRNKPVSDIPALVFGNQAIDGGHLILKREEKLNLVESFPESSKFLRRLYGAEDFIDGHERWCLWINELSIKEALSIPPIKDRVEKVAEYRSEKGEVARSLVNIPYRFRYVHEAKKNLLILPRTTSERRLYLPVDFLNHTAIVTDGVQVIYDPETYIMGILSSRVHMVWVKSVSGRLKSDIRYSNLISYNNFPVPSLSEKQKEMINNHVFEILDTREKYSDKTIGELYDPSKMPNDLLQAHQELDEVVELLYRRTPFESDDERLDYLFKLYEIMSKEKED